MTPTAGTRAAKIAEIHAERARNAAAAGDIGAGLSQISAALEHLDQVRMDLLTRVEDDAIDMLSALSVPLRKLSERAAREQAALDRVLARLRRPTLNIGIVGRARQGKSKFLQSLTGLSTREIPDGSGQFCTGVPSTILHVPGTDTYADVFFHSEASFLGDVVGPYYARLGLGPAPATLAEFKARSLPSLPADSSPKAAERTGPSGQIPSGIRRVRKADRSHLATPDNRWRDTVLRRPGRRERHPAVPGLPGRPPGPDLHPVPARRSERHRRNRPARPWRHQPERLAHSPGGTQGRR